MNSSDEISRPQVQPQPPGQTRAQTKSPSQPKRLVTVVGAGFSGLASAFYLSRAGFQVDVIERQDRPGGLISTVRAPFGLVESAANAFLNSRRVEELFGLLGLELVPTLAAAKRRYIFRRGRPRRWPLGLAASLRLLAFVALYFCARLLIAPRPRETVRNWAVRVMGDEASHYLVEAALQGIYAGDPARMSASLVFSRFFRQSRRNQELEAKSARPKIRGSVSAREGMGQVMTRMRERLERQGVRFIMSQEFKRPDEAPKHPLVIATSAHDAAELLRGIDPARSKACAAVELVPVISVTIGFRDPPPFARGFGCLFPPVESMRALGVLMNTFIFPGRSTKGVSETWLFGGARADRDQLFAMTDEQLVAMAVEERQGALHAGGEQTGFRVTRWPAAIPHYTAALEEDLPEMRGLRRNVILIGNYLGDLGLARILERAARLPNEIKAKGEWAMSEVVK